MRLITLGTLSLVGLIAAGAASAPPQTNTLAVENMTCGTCPSERLDAVPVHNAPMTDKEIPSLYQWAGGIDRIQELFKAFYARVPADPLLGPVFAHMHAEHFETVAHFVSEVLGGPKLYTGDGTHGHSTMVGKHLNRHLTQEQRRRWMTLLLETADDLKLPDDPEFRSALVGYLEWGSRLAVVNSSTDENPIDPTAAMPKWGWGEVKRPYTAD